MKLLIIYRPNSEHGRKIEEFVREFTRRYGDVRIEVVNVDGREGTSLASLYDIVRYPGILALHTDGTAGMIWQGDELPLIDEVASYVYNAA